ncbi:hypothetical protein TRFO_09302 [Tritrichomonas foetus]|uniref:Protein kinase domain-containing protein n=1 Tax=Tritrichomonas foetus TaxID=1144522 RepID=A0A1J4JG16_9EUKA|nr:hypothetical protein TRFO_09302 [Tritrichomonas foetus]|eukprot:OHS97609.1 hypothetical protein TRFO_09302 [Tritrichomonas foetus]
MYTEKLCSTASDMWSLGVILFYMVSGKLPFDSHSPNQLVQKIVHQRPQFPPLISDNLYNLLHGLLRKNREKRFTCEDVRNHPWVKQSNTIPLYSLDDATDFGSSESLGTKIKKREMNTLKLAGVEPTSDLVSPQPEVNSFQTPPLSPHMESDTSDTSPTTSVNTQITSSIEKQLPPTASPTVQPYLSPKVSTNEKSNEKKIPVIRSNTHDMKNLTHNQNPSLTPKRMTAQERLLSSGKFRPLVSHNKSNSMGAKELENAYPVPTSHIRQRLNSSKNPDTILKAFMKPSDLL